MCYTVSLDLKIEQTESGYSLMSLADMPGFLFIAEEVQVIQDSNSYCPYNFQFWDPDGRYEEYAAYEEHLKNNIAKRVQGLEAKKEKKTIESMKVKIPRNRELEEKDDHEDCPFKSKKVEKTKKLEIEVASEHDDDEDAESLPSNKKAKKAKESKEAKRAR